MTVLTRNGEAQAIAQTQGLTAELVRAETMLQIAQEAFTAIEIIYAGMQDLAEMALNENLTDDQRAILNAAFQELKQDIDDIIEATVFDGDQILKGGDGPDGAYVISLSAVGASGAPLNIFIPSFSVIEKLGARKAVTGVPVISCRMSVAKQRSSRNSSGVCE